MPRRVVTARAARSYMERIDQSASFEEAMRHLVHAFSEANRSNESNGRGEVYYYTENLRFVVKEESGVRTALTVLPRWKGPVPTAEELQLAFAVNLSSEEDRKEKWLRRAAKEFAATKRRQEHVLTLQERVRSLREELAEARRLLASAQSSRKRAQAELERMHAAMRPLLALALEEKGANEDAAAALLLVRSIAPELLSVPSGHEEMNGNEQEAVP